MEKPIIFSSAMINAILGNRKIQTRRIIKPQPVYDEDSGYVYIGNVMFDIHDKWDIPMYLKDNARWEIGDILWVKETFFALGKWEKNGTTKTGKQKYRFRDLTKKMDREYMYLVNSDKPAEVETKKDGLIHWYKRPSIFMPRIASRIKLRVTNIRVERVQDITDEDALAEGIEYKEWKNGPVVCSGYKDYTSEGCYCPAPRTSYYSLWTKINGINSWQLNPWVWIIEFEIIK